MCWPEAKVALDIIDDPYAEHVDDSQLEGWQVLKVTLSQVQSLEGSREIGDTLCKMMGKEPPPKTPEWLAANERLFRTLWGM